MLTRTIQNDLLEWKNREHHPLIVRGLRQIGKTFSVRQFGKGNYSNVIYLDLRANKSIHSAFEGDFNVNSMILNITAMVPNARFIPGSTLLILDEIQDCPNARSSLKYWDEDGRFDIIATGSFLGVQDFRDPYSRGIPVGYEESLVMHPLTFKEFLDNVGISKEVLNYVEKQLENGLTIEKAIHESMRSLYLQYLIVGGMPEAVISFLSNHDLNAVRKIQQRIISSISDDFGRFRDSDGINKVNEVLKLRAEGCLKSMPNQLSKEYKKFQYSLVETRGKSVDKAEGLQYLVDVGLITKSFNLKEMKTPLEGNKISTEFKAFYTDTGLLMSQLEKSATIQVLSGNMGAYKGAIAENMIAQTINSLDENLYYYHAPSGSPEIDFIISYNDEPTLIECKSTNNRMTSMKYVIAHPAKYGKHPAIKIADANVGAGEGFITLPLYALGFWKKDTIDIKPKIPNYEELNAILEKIIEK